MIKSWLELYNTNVSEHTVKREVNGRSFEYLDWHTCLKLLYDLVPGVSVQYGFELNQSGYPAFYNPDGKNPFVRVWVEIDGVKRILDYPVISGDTAIWEPTNLEIHNAQQRAFVKCVAINWGLGLSLWQKGNAEPEDDNKEAVSQLLLVFGAKVSKFGDAAGLHAALGTTKAELDRVFKEKDAKRAKELIEKINAL